MGCCSFAIRTIVLTIYTIDMQNGSAKERAGAPFFLRCALSLLSFPLIPCGYFSSANPSCKCRRNVTNFQQMSLQDASLQGLGYISINLLLKDKTIYDSNGRSPMDPTTQRRIEIIICWVLPHGCENQNGCLHGSQSYEKLQGRGTILP